jgi:hypothetical protein
MMVMYDLGRKWPWWSSRSIIVENSLND